MAMHKVHPMWTKLAGTDAKPGKCGKCGSTNVIVQRAKKIIRAQTYAICQDCGRTSPLGGLLSK